MANDGPIRALYGRRDPEVTATSETEPAAPTRVLRTCVFCGTEFWVDPTDLKGARIISEPQLNIDHFVCAGCNDGT